VLLPISETILPPAGDTDMISIQTETARPNGTRTMKTRKSLVDTGFGVLKSATMKITIFWVVMQFSSVEFHSCFWEI
jgi:hypothetical protein